MKKLAILFTAMSVALPGVASADQRHDGHHGWNARYGQDRRHGDYARGDGYHAYRPAPQYSRLDRGYGDRGHGQRDYGHRVYDHRDDRGRH